MGKITGFLEYPRREDPYRSAEERVCDYGELHIPQKRGARIDQAARCMNCGVPFCQSEYGCPLNNLIPEWNGLLYRGLEREALYRLLETAPFPEFTGRVCPALCEKACNLASEGVTNRDNELYLIETGFEKGWIRPRVPAFRSGRRVAVVGSGPSGLAAADLLNRMGHETRVFERADRPGGLLMYGIPNMKLPKNIITRRAELMQREGVRFTLGSEADPDSLKDFDAVLLCGGARKSRRINADNIDAEGVCFAVDYLTEATKAVLAGKESKLSARGCHVVVVGGGDTGNDCVGTAIRQGCLSVTQLEMLPAPPVIRTPSNPWPEWPRTLRTDYGQLEAIAKQGSDPRVYETTVKAVQTDTQGRIASITTVRLEMNAQGQFVPVAGSEKTLPCGLMLIAAGFVGCDEGTLGRFSLTADSRGRLLPPDGTHHLGGKLFSAGDMRTGQSLVVRALADGRAAAKEIDAWLKK